MGRFCIKKDEIETVKGDLVCNELEKLNAYGHSYSIKTIQQSLQLLIGCSTSFRGIEKIFDLFIDDDSQTPSFCTIRKWFGRIGIYELKREKEYRDDWIFITDFTIELGDKKALVILGVTQEKLMKNILDKSGGLSHNDVELLGLEIMDSTKGEIIQSKLEELTEKVGVPLQIVADNGSDLARGIRLYKENHPEVIYTHDVTQRKVCGEGFLPQNFSREAMALLLKYQLKSDDRYQSFIQKCNICRQRLQQTELSFLSPPAQRSQCRYFNIERLTDWGIKLLNSSSETLIKLIPNSDDSLIHPKIRDKLGWLVEYESDLIQWNQMVLMTRRLETQLKHEGISYEVLDSFQKDKLLFVNTSLQNLQINIFEYLNKQCEKLKDKGPFLASSDVIESIFGKYKQFSARCPFKEMGHMLLTICLSTMNLTADVVKNALETISFTQVEEWFCEVFGQSTLSKRKTLFRDNNDDMKTA